MVKPGVAYEALNPGLFYGNMDIGPLEVSVIKLFGIYSMGHAQAADNGLADTRKDNPLAIASLYVAPNPRIGRLMREHLEELVRIIGLKHPTETICLLGDLNPGTHTSAVRKWLREGVCAIINDLAVPTYGNRCLDLKVVDPGTDMTGGLLDGPQRDQTGLIGLDTSGEECRQLLENALENGGEEEQQDASRRFPAVAFAAPLELSDHAGLIMRIEKVEEGRKNAPGFKLDDISDETWEFCNEQLGIYLEEREKEHPCMEAIQNRDEGNRIIRLQYNRTMGAIRRSLQPYYKHRKKMGRRAVTTEDEAIRAAAASELHYLDDIGPEQDVRDVERSANKYLIMTYGKGIEPESFYSI